MDDFNNITYPGRCRPINECLPFEELFRRLQQLSASLQNLSQEEDQRYTALALHLTDDFFLNHPAKDIQLLIACCLADILRIFAPEAPYKDQRVIKVNQMIQFYWKIWEIHVKKFSGNFRFLHSSTERLKRYKRSAIQKIFLFIRKFGIC